MKSSQQNDLRIKFAEQLFEIGNFQKCKKVLTEVLVNEMEINGKIFFKFLNVIL